MAASGEQSLVAPVRRVVSVVGTRPNFMKIAPVMRALEARGVEHRLVHTGQHYDPGLSDTFLAELGMGAPDVALGVGAMTPGRQLGEIVSRLEPVLLDLKPDVVIVPGDVTSTLSAALAAAQLGLPIAHVEAGLRSFDWTMPEERNRVLTDRLSQWLFTHSPEAADNLAREGIDSTRVHDVGNTMIDSLVYMLPEIEAADAARLHGLEEGSYLVVTLHRPALVDGPLLRTALEELGKLARTIPIVFPVHPRTRARISAIGGEPAGAVRLVEPMRYIEFLSLVRTSMGVLTDSGGIQEETTFLGIPCCTLRDSTERPVTLTQGTNMLLGLDLSAIADVPHRLEIARQRSHSLPDRWDGLAGERIASLLTGNRSQPTT